MKTNLSFNQMLIRELSKVNREFNIIYLVLKIRKQVPRAPLNASRKKKLRDLS
ncbi:hypothetical protein [Staphylococcus marylandisciuri]|uniref:hypothetical protein n=1 Tax=Staphylococcus marylandisciuri TaxID=2981529 RepID=UPI0021CDFF4A|nr:hypothetical protein [Staphylococcus marylandisciuri]